MSVIQMLHRIYCQKKLMCIIVSYFFLKLLCFMKKNKTSCSENLTDRERIWSAHKQRQKMLGKQTVSASQRQLLFTPLLPIASHV